MGTILYPDGRQEEVHPENGTDFSLDELHKIVEGFIETIPIPGNKIMVLNEEGRAKGLPRNEQATQLAHLRTPEQIQELLAANKDDPTFRIMYLGDIAEPEYIAGTVLVCERWEIE